MYSDGAINNHTYSFLAQWEASLDGYRRHWHHDEIQPQTGEIYPPDHLEKKAFNHEDIRLCLVRGAWQEENEASKRLTGFPSR